MRAPAPAVSSPFNVYKKKTELPLALTIEERNAHTHREPQTRPRLLGNEECPH
jgi:hypothetical protein